MLSQFSTRAVLGIFEINRKTLSIVTQYFSYPRTTQIMLINTIQIKDALQLYGSSQERLSEIFWDWVKTAILFYY